MTAVPPTAAAAPTPVPATSLRARVGFVLAFLAALAFVGTLGFRLLDRPAFEFDLIPFYCGGAAVAAGRDPYRTEPLRSCEHAVSAAVDNGPAYVIPDPLPAYDQALFAMLSRVPFEVLRPVWFALEFGAFVMTVVLLARVSGASRGVVASALVLSDFWCSGLLGQLVPFAILGLALAGYGLARERRLPVAAGLTLAMIEPHLGGPALAAVALFGGRFRVAAAAPVAVLGIVSLLAMPVPVAIEYVTRVISAHVGSEINNQDQYGTAYALHRLGAPESLAGRLAGVLSFVALTLGVVVARSAARTYGRAMLPFAATAFVLVGGPFVHLPQIAAALPAALVVAARARSRTAAATVALLGIPWLDFSNVLRVLPVAALSSYAILRKLSAIDAPRAGLAIGVALAAIVFAAYGATLHPVGDVIRYGHALATDLPEANWKAVVDAQQHRYTWLADLAKVPTVAALVVLAVTLARESFATRAPAGRPHARSVREATLVTTNS